MAQMKITEGLAEIKTIEKRIATQREFVTQYLARDDRIRDPFERDGGSSQQVEQRLQSIRDLEERRVLIRLKIQEANLRLSLTLNGESRSLSGWLIWRREIAQNRLKFLKQLSAGMQQVRKEAQQKGATVSGVAAAAVQVGQPGAVNIVVHVSERATAEEIESMETILGDLDGQLSLRNATEVIDI